MGKGPQESRFDTAVQGMNEFDVLFAASEWRAGQERLKKVAKALRDAAPKMHEDFGGETGATAMVAFEKVGAAADKRAAEMGEVADALDRTKVAMSDAQSAHTAMGTAPAQPAPYTATGGNDADDLRREQAANRQKNAYDSAMADREKKSQAETDKLEEAYREAMGAMKQAHGEPEPSTGGGGGGGGGAGAGGGGGGGVPVGGGGAGGSHFVPTHDAVFVPAQGDDDSTGSSGTDGTGGSGGSGGSNGTGTTTPVVPAASVGSSQAGGEALTPGGSSTASPIGGIPTSTSASGGVGAPTAGGLAGAIGGGMAGGMAGISGAVRGGGMTAIPTGAAGATSGGRAIGASARSGGASGALGRSAVAGTAGSAGSPTTRGGAARGASGTRGASGGARGAAAGAAGQAGSRGRSGARGAGAGAAGGAGGQGRTKDKKGSKKDEFFEEVQDWIDDEGMAPGVID